MQFSSKSRAGCYITGAITCWDRTAQLQGGLWDSQDRQSSCELLGGSGECGWWWSTGTGCPDGWCMPHPWKLNRTLSNLIESKVPPFIAGVWTRWPLKVPFQVKLLYDFNALHVCRTWHLCQPALASTDQRRQSSVPEASAGLVHDLYSLNKTCLLSGQDTRGIGHHGIRTVSPQHCLWAWLTDTFTHRHGRAGRAHSNPKPTWECKAEGRFLKSSNSQNVHCNQCKSFLGWWNDLCMQRRQ